MKRSILRSGLAALALTGTIASAAVLPASASTKTTRTIIYGAAAAAAAFTLYNVEHKHQLATTVQGYLPDGSAVYEDGHVVSPNGRSWYPSHYGETVACSNRYCSLNGGSGYGYGYNNGYNNGYGSPNGYNGYSSAYGNARTVSRSAGWQRNAERRDRGHGRGHGR